MTPLHFPYLCVWSRLFNSLYTFSGVRPFLATCSMNLQGRRQHLWSTLVPKSWWQVLCRSLQASLAAALQNSAPLTISWRFLKFVFFSPPHMFRQKLHTIHHNSMVFFSAPCWKSWVKVPFGGSPQALGLQRIVRQALWQAQAFKEQADASGAKLQVLALYILYVCVCYDDSMWFDTCTHIIIYINYR